jgi:hypothetical protein
MPKPKLEPPASTAVLPPGMDPFALSVQQVAASESTSVGEIYNRLRRGEYVAMKDGRRLVILFESVKARRAKLRPAKFKPPSMERVIERKLAEAAGT